MFVSEFFIITASLEINHRAEKLLLLFSRKLAFYSAFTRLVLLDIYIFYKRDL